MTKLELQTLCRNALVSMRDKLEGNNIIAAVVMFDPDSGHYATSSSGSTPEVILPIIKHVNDQLQQGRPSTKFDPDAKPDG